jgi:hypothetical protein
VRFLFYTSDKEREIVLHDALRASGLNVSFISDTSQIPDADVYCFVGVKRGELIRKLDAADKTWLYWDKAYNRDWPRWWRVTLCAQQPTGYLMDVNRPADRAVAQGWSRMLRPWRQGKHVLYCGSSAKYHDFVGHDEKDPTAYAEEVVREIHRRTDRRIVYRPKPSWKAATSVPHAEFAPRGKNGDIHAALRGAHCLVTHGSSTCFDALLAGVPSIVLGDGVVRPISSTSLDDLEMPKLAGDEERQQLLANLAYCQWNVDEIRTGATNNYLTSLVENCG